MILRQNIRSDQIKVVRSELLPEKVVIVDGQAGCGKTLFSPILSSLNRVEMLAYAFEIEFICRLFYLGKIDREAAATLVRILVDLKLYQNMMGREVNFRYSDLSSVFKDSDPWKYIKRIFQVGDMEVPGRIERERPILNIATHDMMGVSDPILSGIGSRLVFIEVVRHPLYMIKQQYLNMVRVIDTARNIEVCIEHKGKQLPYFALGWEELYLKSNEMEKAIFSMDRLTKLSSEKRKVEIANNKISMLTIPFEKFVINPSPYMDKIVEMLDTKMTKRTCKVMKKQNVPREQLADSPALGIYKRCGWTPPSGLSEQEELDARRNFVVENASPEALAVIDRLSEEYVSDYLSDPVK